MRIAASVVTQKNPKVLIPSRPTRLMLPSPATPANSAVTTSGITTIESRLRNSVPSGRRLAASVISTGCCGGGRQPQHQAGGQAGRHPHVAAHRAGKVLL